MDTGGDDELVSARMRERLDARGTQAGPSVAPSSRATGMKKAITIRRKHASIDAAIASSLKLISETISARDWSSRNGLQDNKHRSQVLQCRYILKKLELEKRLYFNSLHLFVDKPAWCEFFLNMDEEHRMYFLASVVPRATLVKKNSRDGSPNGGNKAPNVDGKSDEDDEALAGLAASLCTYRTIFRGPNRPMRTSSLSSIMQVEELLNGPHALIFNKVRMGRNTFRTLSAILEDKGLLQATRNLNVDEQLFIFLNIVGQSQSNREAQDQWRCWGRTVYQCFAKVLQAICHMRADFIKLPNYKDVPKFIQMNAQKYRPWFDNCVGAIDGTHIPCVPPREVAEAFRNRKGFVSQNVMAACSFDMKFTFILSGCKGSAHDLQVLNEAVSNPGKGFTRPPQGKFYLVDSAYTNTDCFLAPYRGSPYHLQEYRHQHGGLNSPQKLFNYTHSLLRNCIERTFGVWKARFPILKLLNQYPLENQVMIPMACAVLHNFVHMDREGDELLQRYYCDGVLVTEIDPDNAEPDDGDGDDDDITDGPSLHDNRVDCTNMDRLRDELADQMWVAHAGRPWYRR